jgi:hypothetical protein
MDNIKIKISEFAYEELKKAFNQCPEYSFIRLAFSEGCSKSLKVEIILDNAKENDIKDKVDELPFLYDYNMASKVRELTIVYKDFSLQIKTELYESITKFASSNCGKSSGCSSCSSCGEK